MASTRAALRRAQGRRKHVCSGKLRYGRLEAEERAARTTKRLGQPVEAYLCGHCGFYHQGHRRGSEGKMSDSPVSKLIDSVMSCTKCGAKGVGTCDCWEKCSCDWLAEKGKPCGNPETRRCSSKVNYGTYNWRTKRWE